MSERYPVVVDDLGPIVQCPDGSEYVGPWTQEQAEEFARRLQHHFDMTGEDWDG